MFQKVGEWLTDKSDRLIRGGAARGANGGYYANPEADSAYASMQEAPTDEANAETMEEGADPFGRGGNDEYGGRVPYRSQKDLQAEENARREQLQRQAEEQQRRAEQQAAFGRQAQQAAQAPQGTQRSNVLPFPGMMRMPDGNVYAHVEYIVLLRSRNECTKVIEYIKSNASVFLNMEFIENGSERQRCVDMLSGAAYTLNCRLSKISQRGFYLISSPSVYVVVDPAMQKFASMQEAQGYQRTEAEGYGRYQSAQGYGRQAAPADRAYQERAQMTGRTFRTQAYGAGNPSAYAQQASYGAGAQTSSFARQPAFNGGAQTGAFTAQQQASFNNAGAQTSSFAAQQQASFSNAGAQTSSFAAQPQTAAYTAQQPSFYAQSDARQPMGGFTAASPTAAFAAQPKRRPSSFGMQSAFAKGDYLEPKDESDAPTGRFATGFKS